MDKNSQLEAFLAEKKLNRANLKTQDELVIKGVAAGHGNGEQS